MTLEERLIFTTIQISKKIHKILEEKKTIKRESFNNVIKRLIENDNKSNSKPKIKKIEDQEKK